MRPVWPIHSENRLSSAPQRGSRWRVWIPWEDNDPGVRHHPARKSAGYLGAGRLLCSAVAQPQDFLLQPMIEPTRATKGLLVGKPRYRLNL